MNTILTSRRFPKLSASALLLALIGPLAVRAPSLAGSQRADEHTGSKAPHSDGASEPGFLRDVAPVLVRRCLRCHGPEKSSGNYRLDTFARLRTPGRREDVPVVSGRPGESLLFRLITHERRSRRMPKGGESLTKKEIAAIRAWIAAGARFDGSEEEAPIASLVTVVRHPFPPEPYPAPVPVTAVAFDPQGEELATSGYHEVTFWNPRRGQLLRRAGNVDQRTYALDYGPRGRLLAVAGGAPGRHGEVDLIDLETGRLSQRLVSDSDVVLDVEFDPSGDRLAAATTSGAIRIFDVATGEELRTITNHADWVTSLAWSEDGARLASASRDRRAKVFRVDDGELMTSYGGHGDAVLSIALDGRGQAWSAGRDRRIHVWNVDDGKKITTLGKFENEVYSLVIARERAFFGSADGTVREYDVESRRESRTYRGHRDWVYAVAFSPPANLLAAGSFDGEIRVWNVEDGELVRSFLAVPPPRETLDF